MKSLNDDQAEYSRWERYVEQRRECAFSIVMHVGRMWPCIGPELEIIGVVYSMQRQDIV
jgi:hypothetical protein